MTDVSAERITDIEWNTYGKMKAVRKDQANNTNACTSTEYADADVEYLYTASQQRLCKIVKPHKLAGAGIDDQDTWTYYWYVYDAGGQVMAVYKMSYEDVSNGVWKVNFNTDEHDVYGSGRLGIRDGDDEGEYYQQFNGTMTSGEFSAITYTGNSTAYSKTHYVRELGKKQYEIANHLGNVLVTINDKRLTYSATPSTATTVDWYTADVMSYADYYAFGAPQTGRAGGDGYRYGFNGMEQDEEVKGAAGLNYTTEYRQYDARVGRWFSPDPVVKPWESPYTGFANNPIYYIDPSGLDPKEPKARKRDKEGDIKTRRDYKGNEWVWKFENGKWMGQTAHVKLEEAVINGNDQKSGFWASAGRGIRNFVNWLDNTTKGNSKWSFGISIEAKGKQAKYNPDASKANIDAKIWTIEYESWELLQYLIPKSQDPNGPPGYWRAGQRGPDKVTSQRNTGRIPQEGSSYSPKTPPSPPKTAFDLVEDDEIKPVYSEDGRFVVVHVYSEAATGAIETFWEDPTDRNKELSAKSIAKPLTMEEWRTRNEK